MTCVRRLNFAILVVVAVFAVGCGYSKQRYENVVRPSAYEAVKVLFEQNGILLNAHEYPGLLVGYDKQGYKYIFRLWDKGDSVDVEIKISPSNDALKNQMFNQLGDLLNHR